MKLLNSKKTTATGFFMKVTTFFILFLYFTLLKDKPYGESELVVKNTDEKLKLPITSDCTVKNLGGKTEAGVKNQNKTMVKRAKRSTRKDFEEMASKMRYLAYRAVLYDQVRHDYYHPQRQSETEYHFLMLNYITNRKYLKDDLIELLEHENARVRTLATVALFDQNDPSILPDLFALRNDNAKTFDGYCEHGYPLSPSSAYGSPPKTQTVAFIVRKMIKLYMNKSGFTGVFHDNLQIQDYLNTELKFYKYWSTRKKLTDSAGWIAAHLTRACRGNSNVEQDTNARIEEVRERINRLPKDQRTLTLLWLNGERMGKQLTSEEELLLLCKKLGAEKLIQLLKNNPPSYDPDFYIQKEYSSNYTTMIFFILNNATELFNGEHVEELLECERLHRKLSSNGFRSTIVSPVWAIAAAKISSESSSMILHEAYRRFEKNPHYLDSICVTLWEVEGKSEAKFIIDWLYGNMPDDDYTLSPQRDFLRMVSKSENGQEIVSQIMMDARFNSFNMKTVNVITKEVKLWLHEDVYNKLGLNYFATSYEKWKAYHRQDMKQKRELEVKLPSWRTALLKSIPLWESLRNLNGDTK